jgi:hypothetical protein
MRVHPTAVSFYAENVGTWISAEEAEKEIMEPSNE